MSIYLWEFQVLKCSAYNKHKLIFHKLSFPLYSQSSLTLQAAITSKQIFYFVFFQVEKVTKTRLKSSIWMRLRQTVNTDLLSSKSICKHTIITILLKELDHF